MSTAPNNPAEIMSVLDSLMDHEVSLVLYGRGALSLGFDQPRAEFLATQDVDAIIRLSQLDEIEGDTRFWDALDATNAQLAAKGLYITHLFGEEQVFLRPGMGAAYRPGIASAHALAAAVPPAHH